MPIHLYCLLPASADVPSDTLAGIDGAPVAAFRTGALAAWVSEIDDDRATVARVRAHDAVTSAALATGTTPVPVRYRQRFASTEECERLLQRQEAQILRALQRVAGRVEMDISVVLEPPEATSPDVRATVAPGRRYLETISGRLDAERIVHEQAEPYRLRLSGALANIACEESAAVQTNPSPALLLSHLIDRSAVEEYRAIVASVAGEGWSRVSVVTGPVAPYRFVRLDD